MPPTSSAPTARTWATGQDDLVARLEAPYAPRIQRAVRDVLNDDALTDPDKASQLLELADHLGLVRQPAPQPLPPIEPDDIHLICWTVILPDYPSPQATADSA